MEDSTDGRIFTYQGSMPPDDVLKTFPRQGDYVRFLGCNSVQAELDEASTEFYVGQVLLVDHCFIGRSESLLKIRGSGNWNTSMFEIVKVKRSKRND